MEEVEGGVEAQEANQGTVLARQLVQVHEKLLGESVQEAKVDGT